jgi:hypothetical protein
MAKTASLNATNRPVSRCAEGESAPALPPGARVTAGQRAQRLTEDTPAAERRDGRRASVAAGTASTGENYERDAAYTLIQGASSETILGGRDGTFDCVGQRDPC